MKEEYTAPVLEVIGELREVTAASSGGPTADLIFSVFGTTSVAS
ncbi:MAG: lasso RiPP family leader peptide-containing protein [Pseudonocardia sp.]